MGYIRHNAIIVTSWDCDHLKLAHRKAKAIFKEIASITPITEATMNSYMSFLVTPDGGKEGWDHSEKGDWIRDEFVTWLNSRRYENGSTPLAFVEVQYADKEKDTRIIRHSSETIDA